MIPTDSLFTAHYEKNNSLNMIISSYNHIPVNKVTSVVYIDHIFFLSISSMEMWIVLTNTTFSHLWVLDSYISTHIKSCMYR